VKPAPGPDFRRFERGEIEQSLPARFEAQVARFPDRLAVRAGGEELSYGELNARANRIARAIRERRGDAEEPAALLVSQGAGLIAAILGALKAGKLYVPLDPSHPRPRIREVLDEAGAALLVADAANRILATELVSGARGVLDIDAIDPASRSDDLALPVSPDRGAYIFYTSGSTGRPKGVVDTHRNVLHNVMRYTNSLAIGSEDRLSLVQSSTFSGTVSSVFGALANGAALLPFDLRREGTARLADWVARERITIFHSVPAIFRALLNADGGRRYPALRLVRLEGDRALRLDVALFRMHLETGALLVNGLGATETGLCRQFFLDHETDFAGGLVPVGYPVEDMTVTIVGENGAPAAEGRVGEVAVRSRFLAKGYWRNPDLDRQAFVADPARPGERTYRTGDVGRLAADDCLELFGRTDRALKIRGVRVEPAETERALLALDGVREAAVVARPDRSGEPRLTAYVVASAEPGPTAGTLRRLLSATLPAVSIPARFVALPSLPVDGQGKLDRRGLSEAEPEAAQSPSRRGLLPDVAPRDRLERRLTRIWEEVLAIERIGTSDDFFELGGDSLAALRIAARAERIAGIPVAPSLLSSAPTIRSLAAAVNEEKRRQRSADPLVAFGISKPGSRPPFFFSPSRRGEIARYAPLALRLGPSQPFYLTRWVRGRNPSAPPASVEEMAEGIVRQIRSVQPAGPYSLGGFCFGAVVALEAARQLRAAGGSIALLALVSIGVFDFPSLISRAARERDPAAPSVGTLARLRWIAGTARVRAREIGGDLAWLAACRAWRLTRRTLPGRLRDADRISRRAHAAYVPRPDPGPVSLFLPRPSSAPDSAIDFRGLSIGDIEVHELPYSHAAILVEPYVADLAERLRGALDRAGRPTSPRP
jgi:amino acid adenylation domain-containing protein